MAYTPATKIPTTMKFFQWARVDAPNPRLAAPIDDDDTTLTFTSAPLDKDGAVIDGDFLMNVKNSNSFTELIYVPSGEMSADGLTATNVIRGVRITGLDFTTGDPDFADSHGQDSPVGCAVNAVYENILQAWFAGTLASGGSGLVIGTDALGTVTFSRSTGTGTSVGFLRWLTGTAKAQFSNDGVSWVNFDSVAASNLVAVSAADTTPNYLQNKFNSGDGLTEAIGTPGGDETLNVSVNASDLVSGDYGLETSSNDFRVKLSATPGLEFSTGLQVKVKASGGITKDSDGLSLTSAFSPTIPLLVAEGVTADDAVALLPYEAQFYTQLTDTTIALGDSNVRRKYAIKIVPKTTTSTLTTMLFRAAEQVNGATATGNLTISIQTDSAGAPSGTAISNGTANVITQVTQRTWNTTFANRTATWASSPTLTAGTTYWIVFECASTDAANYLKIATNAAHDENYVAFTRLTYNLDTTSWGSSVTNSTPWFWFSAQPVILGMGLVPCDASWGARTWNFVGFAQATTAAEGTCNVYYATVPDLASLTPGAVYYLSETTGQLTTTPPTCVYTEGTEPTAFAYRIGKAISTTTLKIDLGQKRVPIRESTQISTTTARNYVIWFQPDFIRVSGTGGEASDSAVSMGFVTPDGGDMSVNMAYNNAAAGSTTASTSVSLDTTTDSANKFQGAGASLTAAGFSYTFTESGTANMYALLEAVA